MGFQRVFLVNGETERYTSGMDNSGKPDNVIVLDSKRAGRLETRLRFVVLGPPVGYTTNNGRFYNTKRKKKYLDYKKLVQETCPFRLPLESSKSAPVHIRTVAYFVNGTHPDPENVHKGVKDALFYGASGAGDKYTGGSYEPPLYDAKNPRVEVEIIEHFGE